MHQRMNGIELETGGALIKYTQTAVHTGGVEHVQEARYRQEFDVPKGAPPCAYNPGESGA